MSQGTPPPIDARRPKRKGNRARYEAAPGRLRISIKVGEVGNGRCNFPQSHYEHVRKVVSIWVCTHPPRKYAGTVTRFAIEPEELLGHAPFPRADYDLLELVMACLDNKKPGSSPGALGMLEVLLSTRISAGAKLAMLHERHGIIVTKEVDEKVGDMCNLSKGVLEEGFKQGIQQGRAEERRAFLDIAARMVRDGILALSEAAERFGFTENELAAAL